MFSKSYKHVLNEKTYHHKRYITNKIFEPHQAALPLHYKQFRKPTFGAFRSISTLSFLHEKPIFDQRGRNRYDWQ